MENTECVSVNVPLEIVRQDIFTVEDSLLSCDGCGKLLCILEGDVHWTMRVLIDCALVFCDKCVSTIAGMGYGERCETILRLISRSCY